MEVPVRNNRVLLQLKCYETNLSSLNSLPNRMGVALYHNFKDNRARKAAFD